MPQEARCVTPAGSAGRGAASSPWTSRAAPRAPRCAAAAAVAARASSMRPGCPQTCPGSQWFQRVRRPHVDEQDLQSSLRRPGCCARVACILSEICKICCPEATYSHALQGVLCCPEATYSHALQGVLCQHRRCALVAGTTYATLNLCCCGFKMDRLHVNETPAAAPAPIAAHTGPAPTAPQSQQAHIGAEAPGYQPPQNQQILRAAEPSQDTTVIGYPTVKTV